MVVSVTVVASLSPTVVTPSAQVTMASEEAKTSVQEAVITTSAAEGVVIGTPRALVVIVEAATRLGMLLRRTAVAGKAPVASNMLPWQG